MQQTSGKATAKHLTKREKKIRNAAEEQLQVGTLQPTPPNYLNTAQKRIYRWLYRQLEPTGVMSSLDTKIMANAAVIIDRMEQMDAYINKNPDLLTEKDTVNARDKYFKQYIVVCQQLGLSPIARAKFGTLALKNSKEKADPLLAALGGNS